MIIAAIAATLSSKAFVPPPPPVPPPIVVVPGVAPARAGVDKTQWLRRAAAANACRRAYYGEDYLPQPAIWKIADADSTVYLFGTIHALPLGFDWRSPQMQQIIDTADSLITETGREFRPHSLTAIGQVMRTPDGNDRPVPIADRVSGERRAKWIGMAAMMPQSAAAELDKSPSWLAAIVIAELPSRFLKPSMTTGVDDQLEAEFTKAGKPISAMEDGKAVLASLNTIPEGVQRELLASALDHVGAPRSLEQRMALLHEWARGSAIHSSASSVPTEYLRDRLLAKRNRAWVDVIKQRMAKPGTTLVAVGAGHLGGDGSLMELLATAGLRAERISPTSAPLPRPKFEPMPKNWEECAKYQTGAAVPQSGAE